MIYSRYQTRGIAAEWKLRGTFIDVKAGLNYDQIAEHTYHVV